MGYGDLKGDGEGIKKDMTDQEIYKVLIDLEFLKNDSQKTSRSDENVTPSESIAVKIKKLYELYKSGALGEEEFTLSKKMLLFYLPHLLKRMLKVPILRISLNFQKLLLKNLQKRLKKKN